MKKVTLLKRNPVKEILHALKHEKRDSVLKNKLLRYHPYDLSQAFQKLTPDEREVFYRVLTPEELAPIFEQFDEEKAVDYLQEMSVKEATSMLENMEPDDAADILGSLDEEEQAPYLAIMSPDVREDLESLSKYADSTAGSEMNSDYVELDPEMDVKQAMKILVKQADAIETIDSLFVTDENNVLQGVVDLKALIVAKFPKKVKDIMETNFHYVLVNDDIEDVVKEIQNYDTLAMPVLDDEHHMLGIITLDDALDIIEQEAHDDYAKLAAVSTEHDMDESAFKSAKRRLPWLATLLVLNFLVSSVLSGFEATIAAITALVMFQPLILDMAGNIGTQALAVTVLGISRDTFDEKGSVAKHVFKETGVGLINGTILGVLAFLTSLIFLTVMPVQNTEVLMVAIVVGISVLAALTVSSFLGAIVPITLTKLNIDPAVASGPFITTLNDIVALVIYFSLAALLILNL